MILSHQSCVGILYDLMPSSDPSMKFRECHEDGCAEEGLQYIAEEVSMNCLSRCTSNVQGKCNAIRSSVGC